MPEQPTFAQGPDANRGQTHSVAGPGQTNSLPDQAATTSGDSRPAVTHPPVDASRYVLGDEIARGGMGIIYRATDTVFGREVAVKVLQNRFAPTSGAASRFLDEARITGQLQHPAIPPAHDLGTLPDGRLFLAMKLIRGQTLDELLAERADPSDDRGRFVAAFEHVCQAVAYAHAHNVIHRDLKPANIMVGSYGEVQVMDWGLAKVLPIGGRTSAGADPNETTAATEIHSLRDSDGSYTQAGSVLGTPAFMPPEQAVGAVGKIDTRSDVFGLGAVLAVILTGKPPFEASSAETTRIHAAQGKVDECFARLDSCGADPGLVELCKRCLSPSPSDRPTDAGAVAKAVADLRAAADERARRAELDRVKAEGEKLAAEMKATEQRKRRRVKLLLGVAVGVLLLGVGAAAWWRADQARAASERLGRNAEAVAALLDQCEDALKAGDAAKAAVTLEVAQKRAAEGGAESLASRLEGLGADLRVLKDLDEVDQFRWTPVRAVYPAPTVVASRYLAALERFGANPETASTEEVAARVTGSAVRDRLVATLNRVLVAEKSEKVRAILAMIDPDPFRDTVRKAVRAGDDAAVADLAGRPEALAQPSGFVAVLGEHEGVPEKRKRELLMRAIRQRPGDLGVLMVLGSFGGDDRLRWLQAAVVAAPNNPATHYNLGDALREKGDMDGAVAAFKEAIRINPNNPGNHFGLGTALRGRGDEDGAIAAQMEAIRIGANETKSIFIVSHLELFNIILIGRHDIDRYVAVMQELSQRYGSSYLYFELGNALQWKGNLDGAIAAYQEALRLAPKSSDALLSLRNAERMRDVRPRIPDIVAGRAKPSTPAEAVVVARSLWDKTWELWWANTPLRFSLAARLYGEAFTHDPMLAADLVNQHRYSAACCATRAARGEGVDAPSDPSERAVLRRQAIVWLRADLALYHKQATSASGSERKTTVERLTHWLNDPDLSWVRHPFLLGTSTADEAKQWLAFWDEVRATRDEALQPAPPLEVAPSPRPKG